jgi:hypothetical protein
MYVKEGCPWCQAAREYFARHGLSVDELRQVSGQELTPTLKYGDFVVKDFSVEEFEAALNASPAIKSELGLN